jgi:arylsulfatase A-like enzyme
MLSQITGRVTATTPLPFAAGADPVGGGARRFQNITDDTVRLFATAVSAQDDMVGAVLDALEAEGIANDTIVFFSGVVGYLLMQILRPPPPPP